MRDVDLFHSSASGFSVLPVPLVEQAVFGPLHVGDTFAKTSVATAVLVSPLLYPMPLVCLFSWQHRTIFIPALSSGLDPSTCVLSPECTEVNAFLAFVLAVFLVENFTMTFFSV